MSELIKALRRNPCFYAEKGASVIQIEQAEKTLGLEFAFDFKECLREFGAVSFGSHEFTGFSADDNLDVVAVTQKHWQKSNVAKSLYVIEETHIDGIVICQNSIGEVFQTQPGREATKIADSICDYLTLFK